MDEQQRSTQTISPGHDEDHPVDAVVFQDIRLLRNHLSNKRSHRLTSIFVVICQINRERGYCDLSHARLGALVGMDRHAASRVVHDLLREKAIKKFPGSVLRPLLEIPGELGPKQGDLTLSLQQQRGRDDNIETLSLQQQRGRDDNIETLSLQQHPENDTLYTSNTKVLETSSTAHARAPASVPARARPAEEVVDREDQFLGLTEEEFNSIVPKWNDFARTHGLSEVTNIPPSWLPKIRANIQSIVPRYDAILGKIAASTFLLGSGTTNKWRASFRWLWTKEDTAEKVFGGEYGDRAVNSRTAENPVRRHNKTDQELDELYPEDQIMDGHGNPIRGEA